MAVQMNLKSMDSSNLSAYISHSNFVNWITGKIKEQGSTVAPRNPIALYRSTINTSDVSCCPGFPGAIRVLTAVRQVDKRLKRKIA